VCSWSFPNEEWSTSLPFLSSALRGPSPPPPAWRRPTRYSLAIITGSVASSCDPILKRETLTHGARCVLSLREKSESALTETFWFASQIQILPVYVPPGKLLPTTFTSCLCFSLTYEDIFLINRTEPSLFHSLIFQSKVTIHIYHH
jgi:hypothetical protein